MDMVEEVIRGRSRRMRRPVGEESMTCRRRLMKYGVAVVSPRVAIRSVPTNLYSQNGLKWPFHVA